MSTRIGRVTAAWSPPEGARPPTPAPSDRGPGRPRHYTVVGDVQAPDDLPSALA